MERLELLKNLDSSRNIITAISKEQQKLESINSQIDEVNKKIEQIKGYGVGCFVVMAAVVIAVFIHFILCILVIALSFIADAKYFTPKREQKAELYYNKSMPQLLQNKSAVEEELKKLYSSKEAKDMMEFIPDKYQSVHAANFIYEAVDNQRADTLKEALNLYEEDSHRTRMETMQKEQIETARESLKKQREVLDTQRELLDEAKKTTEATNRTAASVRHKNVRDFINDFF